MKSLLALALISLIISGYATEDISIEIDFANSESQSTDITITDGTDEIEVNIWSESASDESGAQTSSIYIAGNDESGSSTSEDDVVVTIDTYVDENTTAAEITYGDSEGVYADLGYVESTSSDENSTTTDTYIYHDAGKISEEEDYVYNETTGEWEYTSYTEEVVYSQDYVYSSTETTVNDDGSVSESTITIGSVGDYGFVATEDVTVTDDENGGGSKSVDKDVVWWVNTQQEIANALGSISVLTWIGFSAAVIAIIFLVYKKMTTRKDIVHAVNEETTSYIRI